MIESVIKQNHDQISEKTKCNFILETMFFICVNHVSVAIDLQRKCEMIFLRKRSKIMTRQSQVHDDNLQRYTFTI